MQAERNKESLIEHVRRRAGHAKAMLKLRQECANRELTPIEPLAFELEYTEFVIFDILPCGSDLVLEPPASDDEHCHLSDEPARFLLDNVPTAFSLDRRIDLSDAVQQSLWFELALSDAVSEEEIERLLEQEIRRIEAEREA